MKNLFLFLILSVLTGGKNYTQAASSRDAIVYQEKDVRFTMLAEGGGSYGMESFQTVCGCTFFCGCGEKFTGSGI